MTSDESAATQLADTFGRYMAAANDWQLQNELWEAMKTLHKVHRAERAAAAAARLEGL